MAFFMVGAVGAVEIQSKSGATLTYEDVGPTFVAYGGNIRSQIKAKRRVWQGDTPPLLWADADALVSTIGLGLTTVGGDWPGSVAADIPVLMEVLGDNPIKDVTVPSLDARRVLTLRAREILAP